MNKTTAQDQLRAAASIIRDPESVLTADARALLAASLDEQADTLTTLELLVLTTPNSPMTVEELDESIERKAPAFVRFARAVVGEDTP